MAPRSYASRSTPDRQPGVLNDRRRKPRSLRREANDGRQRELARGLENKLANVAMSQYLDAWYQSLTSSLFFLAKELGQTSSLSRPGIVAMARSTIELEGTAWASRHVLLCEWGDSATKFTMNVSIKTSCFRSKTPPESSCRQSRPDRSSSASRGCVQVHVPAYRWVNFGSFAKACHSKSVYPSFLLFLEQQGEHEHYSLTKNQERTTLPSTTNDRQRARVKRKNVCKSKA